MRCVILLNKSEWKTLNSHKFTPFLSRIQSTKYSYCWTNDFQFGGNHQNNKIPVNKTVKTEIILEIKAM